MKDAKESKTATSQCRKCRLAMTTIAVIAVAYAVGYRMGGARQEKRLLNEFLVNAANLGIIDYDRLRALTEDAGTNTEIETASDNGQGGVK